MTTQEPPQPNASRASPVHPRDAIAAALAGLLAGGEPWPNDHPVRLRNLLLDASGSDHRALVELLLRVGRHGIADALRQLGTVAASDWPARRAPLVARTTGELFVDAEVAAWAVDSWAVALGTLTAEQLQQMRQQHDAGAAAHARASAERGSGSGSTGSGGAARAGPARPMRVVNVGTGGMVGATGRTVPGAPGVPSWAGGTRSTRFGAVPKGQRTLFVNRWQGSSAPVPVPNVRRNLTVMAIVMSLAVAVVLLTPRDRPAGELSFADGGARAGGTDSAGASTGAASVAATGSATDAATRDDSMRDARAFAGTDSTSAALGALTGRVIRRAAIGATADAPGPLPRPLPVPPVLPPAAASAEDLDTIRMDDGRVLVGAIRLVAPTALFVHDVRSGLEYALPIGRVSSVTTRTGASLPLPARAAASRGDADAFGRDGGAANAAALLAAGVGGSYRVEQRVRSVEGNTLCGPVAEALGRDVIRSVEEVRHEPGARTFVLVTRPGVRGTLEPDARFATEPYVASRDGVRFTFRMVGQFTPGGFTARTVTETEAVIRYRRTQTCRIVADLLATRTLGP